jgi:predicted enzyme related to lactoylglutathione lyase
MFKKLRTVIYHAPDLQAVKQWYIQVTGQQPYFDEPFYVGFDIHGFELGLDPDMSGVVHGNQSTAYWAVDDIQAAVEKLVGAGAGIVQPVTDVGGGIQTAIVADPWDNVIGLIYGA